MRFNWKVSTVFSTSLLSLSALVWTACGSGPPFDPNGGPPTFALKYEIEGRSDLVSLSGSTFVGNWTIDIALSGKSTKGSIKSFGPKSIGLGAYYPIEDGRWPATWYFQTVAGCGAGQQGSVDILSKVVVATCIPVRALMQVSYNPLVSDTVTVSFDTAEIPPYESAHLYVAHDTWGTLGVDENVTVSSTGTIQFSAPYDYEGIHQIVVEFPYRPNGFEASAEEIYLDGAYCPAHAC